MNEKRNTTPKNPLPIRRMIKAYPARHQCLLREGQHVATAQLIDMNHISARVKFPSIATAQAFEYSSHLTLDPELDLHARKIHPVHCQVAWRQDDEIGLEFKHRLNVGIAELQQAFSDADN